MNSVSLWRKLVDSSGRMEQMIVFFFFIAMLSSAAENIKSNLTRVQGGSVTFPDPVLENGLLYFGPEVIASVQDRICKIWTKTFDNRLFWNNKTGLFTLRELQKPADSGIFRIHPKDGEDVATVHKLTVYDPVSAPEVTKLTMSTESCTLLCEVQNAEETTLYWYRDTEILNQSSLALSVPLSLPLTVEDLSSSYKCVAKNPAENKTLPANAMTLCHGQNISSPTEKYRIVVPIVFAAAIVIVALLAVRWIYIKRKAAQETQGSEHRESDVVYTDVHIPEDRRRQERNQLDSPGADEGSSLTTLYDKIQAHRITPAETEACLYSKTANSHA